MLGDGEQRAADLGVAAETFGAVDEPEVELVLEAADLRGQLGVEALRIVDEVAGMHLEEAREQKPRLVRQVRTPAALDLRQIGLADRVLQLGADRARNLGLAHVAVQAAQGALDRTEVAKLLSQRHSNQLSIYSNLKL